MQRLISLMTSLFIITICHAETRTYLVYRQNNFQQDRYLITVTTPTYRTFSATGTTTISAAGGQPFRLTNYQKSADGKYAVWTVTPKTQIDRTRLASMESKGYIVLMSTMDAVVEFVPEKGGTEIVPVYSGELAKLPTDYYTTSDSVTTGTDGN